MANDYADAMHLRKGFSTAILCLTIALSAHAAPAYKYIRIGSQQDRITQPQASFALMGGGADLDQAFRFLCTRAHSGDFLILRATGSDDYNPYVAGLEDGRLCQLNSVATLILPNRESAEDIFIAETIRHAEAIFIAGGDQANYIRNWTHTPVQRELNAAVARGVPIGGTSAGLAVLGEWAYSAEGDKPEDPNLDAKTALADPSGPRITLAHNFLDIPILRGILTDTHFAKRNRMGRLLAFLAQIHAKNPTQTIHGLGIEERCAILLDPDGHGQVVGHGAAYLVSLMQAPGKLLAGKPLSNGVFSVQKAASGTTVDIAQWKTGSLPYSLVVLNGKITQPKEVDAIY